MKAGSGAEPPRQWNLTSAVIVTAGAGAQVAEAWLVREP